MRLPVTTQKILNKYEHVIWDWNGTILDDVKLCVDILNHTLEKRGLEHVTLDQHREKFVFPVKEYYKSVGLDVSGNNYELMSHEFINEYELRKNECKLFQDAVKVLDLLNQNKIGQSVLSAYSQSALEKIVAQFGLSRFFIKLVGLDNIYAKSKMENGKNWINELKIIPQKVLFIGDTVHDYEVASEIGVDCVLVASGHQSKEMLIRTGVPVFDSLVQLFNN